MTTKQKLVVIGNGMTGARLVEEVLARRGGDLFDIVMFGDEPYGNYNRILLSSVLSRTHDPRDIFINPLDWYAANRIRLHAGVRVTEIERTAKTVYGTDGVMGTYDKLIIATGSRPFIPSIDGLYRAARPSWSGTRVPGINGDPGRSDMTEWKEGIFVFRTLDDCDAIIKYAAVAQRVAVIGGGLLGLEAARGLLNMGLEVHVVHLMPHLMEMQLDAPAGSVLKNTLERMGVHIQLEKATTAIQGEERVTGLTFKDGSTLECDMVVISAGIRPNTELAKEAGLAVERGIVVGDDLACLGDPDVFAIGECAQHRGRLYGLVAPLWEQAHVLADRLTGRTSQAMYVGSKVSTKLKVMGIELAVMGEKEPSATEDEVITYVENSRGIYKKLIVRQGRLTGAILLGDGTAAPKLLQAFDRSSELPENRAELLFALAGEAQPQSAADLPDTAQICNCNGVAKGAIVAAVKGGCRTLKAVCNATRAGTGCGSCKPQVKELLEVAADGLVVDDPSVHYYVPGVPLPMENLRRRRGGVARSQGRFVVRGGHE